MRKITLILIAIVLLSSTISAQKSKVGITLTPFAWNSLVRFTPYNIDDSYTAKNSFSLGAVYITPLFKKYDLETGFEFGHYYIDVAGKSSVKSVSLLNFPLGIRYNWQKNIFLNTGLLADIDLSNKSPMDVDGNDNDAVYQNGIGAYIGAGYTFELKNGFSMFVNPYLKAHKIVYPFDKEWNSLRIFDYGIKVGVTYDLK